MTIATTTADAAPAVSCIIIFLDEQRFLGEAIESVLSQSTADWELLAVDDGSTDQSSEIAQRYAKAHPRQIRYLTHPGRANRGMSASRNLGLRHIRGRYVAFLDGDDQWLPDKLEHQLGLFAQFPDAGMVCGSTLYWHSWEVPRQAPDRIVATGELPGGGQAVKLNALIGPPRLFRALYPLGRGASPSTSGLMARREMIEQGGGFVDRFTGLYEDQVFKIKAYLAAPVYVSDKVYDRYRQHSASTVALGDVTGVREARRLEYLEWLGAYLRQYRSRDLIGRFQLHWALLRFRFPRLRRVWLRVKPILAWRG